MTSTDDPQEPALPPAAEAAHTEPAPPVEGDAETPTDAAASDAMASHEAASDAVPPASPNEEPAASATAEATADAAAGAASKTPAPDLSPAATGTRLAALFPALFVGPDGNGTWKALKLRIHADIQARAPGQFSKRALGIFFSRYTTTTAYLRALAAPGAQRFDLDGQPAGEIAEEHRSAAALEVERRRSIAIERRAAQRKPPRAAAQPSPPAATGDTPMRSAAEARPPRPPRDGGDVAQAPRPARREQEPRRERRDDAPRRGAAPARGPGEEMRGERPAPFVRQPPRERPPPAAPALPADPAQRERAQLLRAFESSPLSKANFCVLKRISEAELDTQLAQARAERG